MSNDPNSPRDPELLPESSPGMQRTRTGVRRINNLPVVIGSGVVVAFLAMMGLVAADRAEQQRATTEAGANKVAETHVMADTVVGDFKNRNGMIPSDKGIVVPKALMNDLTPSHTDAGVVPVEKPILIANALPASADSPPLPSDAADGLAPPGELSFSAPIDYSAGSNSADSRVAALAQARRQMLEDAIKAKSTVVFTPTPSVSEGSAKDRSSLQDMLHTQAANQALSPKDMAQMLATLTGKDQEHPGPKLLKPGMAQFGDDKKDRWRLDNQVEPPRSNFELRAGFVIPATLITGINSQLPGQILGQVSQNVYDTATGKFLLIPQGTRLVGTYSSEVAYGGSRVLVAWQRLVFPDGKAMDIGEMPGSDSAGYAGFGDHANQHFVRIFGSALLMSAVAAGISYSASKQASAADKGVMDFNSALSASTGQQMGSAASEMIKKNLNISPTVEIRPGYRFNVVVTKDLTFQRPYLAFDYR